MSSLKQILKAATSGQAPKARNRTTINPLLKKGGCHTADTSKSRKKRSRRDAKKHIKKTLSQY